MRNKVKTSVTNYGADTGAGSILLHRCQYGRASCVRARRVRREGAGPARDIGATTSQPLPILPADPRFAAVTGGIPHACRGGRQGAMATDGPGALWAPADKRDLAAYQALHVFCS